MLFNIRHVSPLATAVTVKVVIWINGEARRFLIVEWATADVVLALTP
jgi:hypothetical protein